MCRLLISQITHSQITHFRTNVINCPVKLPIGQYHLSLTSGKVTYHVTVNAQLPYMAVFKFESGKAQLLPRAMHLPSFTVLEPHALHGYI